MCYYRHEVIPCYFWWTHWMLFICSDDVEGGLWGLSPFLKFSTLGMLNPPSRYWSVHFYVFSLKQFTVIIKQKFHIWVHLFVQPWHYSQLDFDFVAPLLTCSLTIQLILYKLNGPPAILWMVISKIYKCLNLRDILWLRMISAIKN